MAEHRRTAGHGEACRTGTRRSRTGRRLLLPAVLAAAGLVLAGCADSSSETSQSSSSTTGSSGGISAGSLATIADYTGSTSGAADTSLKPVTWGFVNQQGGALDFKQYTEQGNALVKVVNTELGGIGGHPLKLDVCHVVSSDEEGQACGQQFANNPAITAIIEFPLINGNASFHRVIDPTGIPVFGSSASSKQDAQAKTSFFMTSPEFDQVPIMTKYASQTLRAKSVALIGVEGEPISAMITGNLKTGLEAAGLTVKLATVSATSTDVTAPLVAANVKSADVIIPLLPTTPLCANVAKALKTLGAAKTPVLSIAQCGTDDVKKVLGDYPQWTFLTGYPLKQAPPLDGRETAELKVADELWKSVGAKPGDDIYASPTTQVFLTALGVVNKAGGAKATRATTLAAARAYDSDLWLGPDSIRWGTNPMFPALAGGAERLFSYTGNGTWVDAGKGWYRAS